MLYKGVVYSAYQDTSETEESCVFVSGVNFHVKHHYSLNTNTLRHYVIQTFCTNSVWTLNLSDSAVVGKELRK